MTDIDELNGAFFQVRIALLTLACPPQAQRRHVQLGMMRRAAQTMASFDTRRYDFVEADLLDNVTAALVSRTADELKGRLDADPDFFRESVAGPREFLFGSELETEEWNSFRMLAREAFHAVAGETSAFVSLVAK